MTKTLQTATAIFTWLLAASSFAAEEKASLFNGRDLTGWNVEGTREDSQGHAVWRVEDESIVCHGHGFGFLRHDQMVDDFVLALEFRLAEKANSGVGIRHGKYTGKRGTRPSLAGYEIQLLDDPDQPVSKISSGSLYRYVSPLERAMKPVGEWNRLVVECRGPVLTITLNGKIIHDLDQSTLAATKAKPLSGYISLQNHGGEVAFRDIQLERAPDTVSPKTTAVREE